MMNMTLEQNLNFDDYYRLGESLAQQGNLEGAIACYRRAVLLNPNFSEKCFLDNLEVISSFQVNVKQLAIVPGQNTQETCEGQIVSLKGNQGFVFYGPYMDIPDGLYRVRVLFEFPELSLDSTGEDYKNSGFKFDIMSPFPHLLYETQVDNHQTSLEFYIDFLDCQRTEFRFVANGEAFSVNFIELSLLYEPGSQSDAAYYYFDLGSILQFQEKRYQANQAYFRAVEICPKKSLVDYLANCQNALPNPAELAEAYLSLGGILEQQGKWEETKACYDQVIHLGVNSVEVYQKLAIILAKDGKLDEAVACFNRAKRQPSDGEIYDYIWKGLNQLAPFDETNPDYSNEIQREAVGAYFSETSKYTVINVPSLADLTEDEKTIIEKAHLSLANLELIKQDSLYLEEIYSNNFKDSKSLQLAKQVTRKVGFSWHLLNANDSQQNIVENGFIYAVCPVSGTIIRSNQSFYIQHNTVVPIIFYRFEGQEIFYLMVGGWSSGKICIYFPRLELVINLCLEYCSWLSCDQIINEFKANCVSYWQKVKAYISTKKSKEVVSILGVYPNLGHYFWNEVTGINFLHENGILHKVDKFLIGSYKYLDIADIFPEIPPDRLVYISDNQSIFLTMLENNYFAVRVTNSFLNQQLANRIYSASINKCSQTFLQKIKQAKKHFPLLWINLRSHNKSWLSEVEGSANIIKKLSEDYPTMAVVFDGFPDEKANMDKIQALIPPTVEVYNALDCPLHETIVWANAIDTYIAIIGSGLTLVTWLANKPGVVHSNKAHYLQLNLFWREVRENALAIEVVPVDSITDVDASTTYNNYDFDWNILYDELIKVMNNLEKSKDSVEQADEELEPDTQMLNLIQGELELSQSQLNQTPSELEKIHRQQNQVQKDYLKLDLGCGGNKKPGTIGLDYCYVPGVVDHVLNIQTDILPFPDRSVEYVHSSHTLEHLTDPIHLFQEVSRVCIDGAKLEFWTPYLWHNSAFIYGHTNYYQEDNYMHLCVWFPDFWSASLGARWYLKEIVYVVPPHILVELYKQKIQLEFAIRYYKGFVQEFAAIIEVRHEDKHQTIYPQRSFATSRLGERYLLPSPPEIFEQQELLEAINWFSASSS